MAERKGEGGKGRGRERRDAHDVPLVQWLVAGIALVVVLASFAIVAYQGIRGSDAAPAVSVAVDSMGRDSAGYRVHFTVRNTGGQTAANLVVNGSLRTGANPETGSAQFDYLAPGAQASGVFVFETDPRSGRLETSIGGFTVP